MGACDFYVVAKGATADKAFASAVSDAKYESGHGGYTGTIAEKHSFVMIPFADSAPDPATNRSLAMAYAGAMVSEGDPRVDDKWGPAGCISLGMSEWLFFGTASS